MTTTATTSAKQPFLDAFARLESQPVHPTIQRLRQAGIAAFDRLGFPGPRDEDWKFTSLAPVLRHEYVHSPQPENDPLAAPSISLNPDTAVVKSSDRASAILIRDGLTLPNGVIICSLKDAIQNRPELVEPHLGRIVDHRGHPFVALNTAFLDDGIFVYVPPDTIFDEPIRLNWTQSKSEKDVIRAWHRRTLIVVDRGAQVTLWEAYKEVGWILPYLTTAVTEVVVAENASVDHYKVQQEGDQAFHLATLAVQQQRSSRFSTHYFGLGGALTRHEVRVRFEGEGGEATVNGLYQASGTQHFDNHTVIDHARPHCNSHELYKGVLDGKSRGVFTGKIFVRKDAQKTDAKQTNQTLLLSDDATINTKPQLEIFADDVKCTHGATVGQLDEQQLYYLRTRGIGTAQARALLTFAFANDIIGRVKIPALRQRLEAGLLQAHHLPTTEEE